MSTQPTYAPAPAASGQPRPTTQRRGLLILLGLLLVLTLAIGVAAIGGYFYLRSNRDVQWTWQDPLTAVDAGRVRPDVAVITLLDQPASLLVQQALLASEPDTAYAVLVHDARSGDAERSGNAQLVGREYEAVPAPGLAAIAYQQMLDIAALSPTMADPMRANVSLDAAQGFLRLGLSDAAQPALVQAEVLARYSPLLAPVQRQDIARQLQTIYRELGQEMQANALDQLVREPRGVPTNKFVRGPFLPRFAGALPVADDLQRAIEARRSQVYTFLAAWDSGDQARIEAGRTALAGALLEEDRLRRELLPARVRSAAELPERTALLLDHVQWLALKSMIAGGALGYALVPEWEQARDQIAADLRAAYDALFASYRDQAAALADPDDAAAARVEILRQQNLLGRLGLYPGYDEAALGMALEQAQRDASEILPLLVIRQPWGSESAFRIAETLD